MASDLFSIPAEVDVDSFFKSYDDTLTKLINKHDPVVVMKQYSRRLHHGSTPSVIFRRLEPENSKQSTEQIQTQ